MQDLISDTVVSAEIDSLHYAYWDVANYITRRILERSSAHDIATEKLIVVAINDTVQTVTELSSTIAQKLLTLFPEKLPLDTFRIDIYILTSQLDGNFQKQNQVLNEMTAYI